jgi:hypothetical protein
VPTQLALDEAHNKAYTVEFTTGRLLQIDLTTGATVAVLNGLSNPRGLLLTSDGRFAYISDDTGSVTRIDLISRTALPVASGLGAPRYLTFTDAGESAILVPVNNPAPGMIMRIDLTVTPAAVTEIVGGTPAAPYSVQVASPERLLIASGSAVSQADLVSSVYSAAGPIFLGIGFVPVSKISAGYADTTSDPSYFFQVKDAPFGGTLPLMINHDGVRSAGASYYKVTIQALNGSESVVQQVYSDYKWSTPLNAFELVVVQPSNGLYPVHAAGELWYNAWLGMRLDTSGRPAGLNTIRIGLYNSAGVEIGTRNDPGRAIEVMLDNTFPTARIDSILQNGNAVGECGLVTSGAPLFTFDIDAEAPRHLGGWNLTAYWAGDNRWSTVASDSYANHVSASRQWTGIQNTAVPSPAWNASVPNDLSSTHCGHTFELQVWDRVIDGYALIHGIATSRQAITILL